MTRSTPKLCKLCGRVDTGAPRCRDHEAPEKKGRVLATLTPKEHEDKDNE